VKRIADLAILKLIKMRQSNIDSVIWHFNLIETMQAVDTSSVEPSHAQSVVQRLREDEVTETDQRELCQSIAPQVEAGLYLVPQVIE
jgi:aspartyl-tRNA(Asn)/glutamyl-tRNA(Gln) amidotransferase subunit C